MQRTLNSTSTIKLAAVRGRRLQSHPCAMWPGISKETQRERDVPSAIARFGSAERVCSNSAKMKRSKVIPTGSQREWRTTYASAPKSHHLRERVEGKLIQKSRIENVPILEVIIDVWSEKRMCSQLNGLQVDESQSWLSRPSAPSGRIRAHPFNRPVRYACPIIVRCQ
jgi:hypothetical protein